jgi:hypothetical protein
MIKPVFPGSSGRSPGFRRPALISSFFRAPRLGLGRANAQLLGRCRRGLTRHRILLSQGSNDGLSPGRPPAIARRSSLASWGKLLHLNRIANADAVAIRFKMQIIRFK